MNTSGIPSSFGLMHRRITVEISKELGHKRGNSGETDYYSPSIVLDRNMMDRELTSPECSAQVFWHEVWHHIMGVIGEDELRNNEKLADQFGGLMAQLMATADWETPVCEIKGAK